MIRFFGVLSFLSWLVLLLIAINLIFSSGARYDKYELVFSFSGLAAYFIWALNGVYILALLKRGYWIYPFISFFVLFFFLVLPAYAFVSYGDRFGDDVFLFNLGISFSAIIFFFFLFLSKSRLPSSTVMNGDSFSFDLSVIKWVGSISLLIAVLINIKSLGFVQLSSQLGDSIELSRAGIYDEVGASFSYRLSYYILNLVMPVVLIFLLATNFGGRRSNVYVFSLFLFFTLLLLFSTGSRLQFSKVVFLIGIFLLSYGVVSFGKVFLYSGPFVLVLVFLTVYLSRFESSGLLSGDLSLALNRLFERIFLTKGAASLSGIDYVLSSGTWPRWGGTYFDLLNNTGYRSFAYEVYDHTLGGVGTAGPQSFAEGYINFGFFGVVLTSFIIFPLLSVLTVLSPRALRANKVFYAVFVYISFTIAYSGYSDTFGSYNVVFWAIIFFFLYFVAKRILPRRRAL